MLLASTPMCCLNYCFVLLGESQKHGYLSRALICGDAETEVVVFSLLREEETYEYAYNASQVIIFFGCRNPLLRLRRGIERRHWVDRGQQFSVDKSANK